MCVLAGVALPVAAVAWAATVLHTETVGGRAHRAHRAQAARPAGLRSHALVLASGRPLPRPSAFPPSAGVSVARLDGVVSARPADAATPAAIVSGASETTTGGAGVVRAHADVQVDHPADDAPRFYMYREVDVPAEPVEGWNIDAGELDALATSRLVFTLFIGSDGRILYCRVDVPERLAPQTRRRLADRLSETPMHPAQRGGVAVPSHRRVEIYTDSGA